MDINDCEITIRYDGLDAENHEIELSSLGESLKGFSRIISTVAHFALTQEYIRKTSAQSIKVCATEARANCFSISTVINFVQQNQLLSGSVGAILGVLIPYIFARSANKNEEMKLLKDSLDLAIKELGNKDKDTVNRLLDIVEKMAVDLKPAAKQAVSPIGTTCSKISMNKDQKTFTSINVNDKAEIDKLSENELTGIIELNVKITELDALKFTGKVHLQGDNDPNCRISAVINDPAIESANNPYASALLSGEFITVSAKASLKDGNIVKIYISDAQ